MNGKLALKRLTESDLTLFKWHFQKAETKSKQKAINLNADVLVKALYPSLPVIAGGMNNRLPIDLYIHGPGNAKVENLQRKIIKPGSYKNWRLDGEYIDNPIDDEGRYAPLQPDDFVLFEFFGETHPEKITALFVARSLAVDQSLHEAFDRFLGSRKMVTVEQDELESMLAQAKPLLEHSVNQFVPDEDIEDAALGGIRGIARLKKRRTGRPVTKLELDDRRKSADETGRYGEDLVNGFLSGALEAGKIMGFRWVSNENAIAPYDFEIDEPDGSLTVLDVKSTSGDFERPLHVSFNELLKIVEKEAGYHIYRVYRANPDGARLRICRNIHNLATAIYEAVKGLPSGTSADSFSIDPLMLVFDAEQTILPMGDDE